MAVTACQSSRRRFLSSEAASGMKIRLATARRGRSWLSESCRTSSNAASPAAPGSAAAARATSSWGFVRSPASSAASASMATPQYRGRGDRLHGRGDRARARIDALSHPGLRLQEESGHGEDRDERERAERKDEAWDPRGLFRPERRPELHGELRGRGRPLEAVLRHGVEHDGVDRGRDIHKGWRVVHAHLLQDRDRRRARERRASGEGAVEEGAEPVDVGALVLLLLQAEGLLGRDVGRRPHDLARPGEALRRVAELSGEPEVDDEREPGRVLYENVRGLQVAVNDSPGVGKGDRVGDPEEERAGVGGRERARAADPRFEALALDERHDEVEESLRLSRGVDPDDRGVVERPEDLALAAKAHDLIGRGEVAARERLEREDLAAPVDAVDRAHASLAEEAHDLVAVDHGAGLEERVPHGGENGAGGRAARGRVGARNRMRAMIRDRTRVTGGGSVRYVRIDRYTYIGRPTDGDALDCVF